MKGFKQFMLLLVVLLLGSCSNDLVEPAIKSADNTDATTRVDMQTALDRAEKMLAKIEGGKTRSRRVASIRYLSIDGKTRSAGSLDSLYYIINYADNGGFVVAGADTRLDGIYAISEEGHLEESDVEDNPGLQYFFDMLPDEECLDTGQFPGQMDSTIVIGPPVKFEDFDMSTKKGPYIHKNVSQWAQGHPFNLLCPQENGAACPAGCVPVATAIIMSYHEWPVRYNNVSYNWMNMKEATTFGEIVSSRIPDLLVALGSSNNYNTTYTIEGSGSHTEQYYGRTFMNMGYKKPDSFKDFENKGIKSLIDEKQSPVLVRGALGDDGHAWVIDGYYNDYHIGNAFIGGSGGQGLMFHVIWGWRGSSNGYFKFGGSIVPKQNFNESWDDPSYWSDSRLSNIQYTNMRFVGGFEPNK